MVHTRYMALQRAANSQPKWTKSSLDETQLRALVPVAIGGPAPVITPIGRGDFNSAYWVDGPAGRSVLRVGTIPRAPRQVLADAQGGYASPLTLAPTSALATALHALAGRLCELTGIGSAAPPAGPAQR